MNKSINNFYVLNYVLFLLSLGQLILFVNYTDKWFFTNSLSVICVWKKLFVFYWGGVWKKNRKVRKEIMIMYF